MLGILEGWLPQGRFDTSALSAQRARIISAAAAATPASTIGANGAEGSSGPSAPQQPPLRRKRHRADQIEAAYELQRDAAIKGAVIYTAIGLGATFFSHHLFPRFRSQTLALKAFITSGFTIFGFVVGADTVLLNHEGHQRSEEDLIRGVARRELAKRGIMASETEIEKWKEETRARLLRERNAQE